jgi:hypothetical protein
MATMALSTVDRPRDVFPASALRVVADDSTPNAMSPQSSNAVWWPTGHARTRREIRCMPIAKMNLARKKARRSQTVRFLYGSRLLGFSNWDTATFVVGSWFRHQLME